LVMEGRLEEYIFNRNEIFWMLSWGVRCHDMWGGAINKCRLCLIGGSGED